MKKFFLLAACGALCLCLAACAGGTQTKPERVRNEKSAELQFQTPQDGDPIAIFKTELGEIRAVLYPQHAPMAVENFIGLAQQGYYNGLAFHRIVKDFVIQSGDATGTGTGGSSIWGGNAFPVERSDALHHYSGALGMAHTDGEMTGNLSQFYMVQTPKSSVDKAGTDILEQSGLRKEVADAYRAVGGAPYLDNLYTVFGQVYRGMAVVDEIGAVPCDENGQPKETVLVNSVEISVYSAAEEAAAASAAPSQKDSSAPPAEGDSAPPQDSSAPAE